MLNKTMLSSKLQHTMMMHHGTNSNYYNFFDNYHWETEDIAPLVADLPMVHIPNPPAKPKEKRTKFA